MNKVDTRIRHVTRLDSNLFAELGFSPNEAERYQAESRAQIEHTRCAQVVVTREVDSLGGETVIPHKNR